MKKLLIPLFILLLATNVYAQPDWSLLDEPFDNLNDWVNGDLEEGLSQISPAGYLDQVKGAAGQAKVSQDMGGVGAGDFTVEWKVKPILLPDVQNWLIFEVGISYVSFEILSDGFRVYDGSQYNKTNYAWDAGTYYTIRYIVHNSQTDMDVYVNGALIATDVDCSFTAGTDGNIQFRLSDANSHWSIDYLKVDDGQHVPVVAAGQIMTTIIY